MEMHILSIWVNQENAFSLPNGGILYKKAYIKPEADKNAFTYRDQVAAASGNGDSGDSFVENSASIGSPVCGSGGIVGIIFDYAGFGIYV